MAKVINLEHIARGDALAAIAFNLNPDLNLPTYEETNMAYNDSEAKTVGIRFPTELLDWIDAYSREKAFREGKRVTRNNVVIDMLESQRAIEAAKSSEEPSQ